MSFLNDPSLLSIRNRKSRLRRIEETIRELRSRAGDGGVTSDLAKIARAQSIISVRTHPLVEEARVTQTDAGFLVELSTQHNNSSRRRFSLAHEIAHTIVWESEQPGHERHRGLPGAHERREERVCDLIAAELLMPTPAFREHAGATEPSLAALKVLCKTFRVSVSACLHRVMQLEVWNCAVLYGAWDARNEEYQVHRVYTTSAVSEPERTSSTLPHFSPPARAARYGSRVDGHCWMELGGHIDEYPIQSMSYHTQNSGSLSLLSFGLTTLTSARYLPAICPEMRL